MDGSLFYVGSLVTFSVKCTGILETEVVNVDDSVVHGLRDLAGIELSKKGYNVIEHFLKKELIDEQELNMSGLYQGDPIEMGKLKSIKALLIVSFPRYALFRIGQRSSNINLLGMGVKMGGKDLVQTEVAVTIRLISVTTGDVLYLSTADRKLRGSRLHSATRYVIKESLKDLPLL